MNSKNTTQQHRLIIVSDGTGETAAQLINAAMVQFSSHEVAFTRYKNIRNESQIEAVCEDVKNNGGLVIFTFAAVELRIFILKKCESEKIACVDLLGPILSGIGTYFGYAPKSIAGLLRDINERYFDRIDAIEYTVAHDDGRDFLNIDKADLVILGISRTSKTPLSIYLSHQGWKVVNIPIITGFEVPKELLTIDQRRIIGLTIDAQDLAKIRRARLERLGHNRGGEYADPDKVQQEIEYANEIFKKNRRWPVFNVTGKALEETASEIIKLMVGRRLTPPHTLENMPPTG